MPLNNVNEAAKKSNQDKNEKVTSTQIKQRLELLEQNLLKCRLLQSKLPKTSSFPQTPFSDLNQSDPTKDFLDFQQQYQLWLTSRQNNIFNPYSVPYSPSIPLQYSIPYYSQAVSNLPIWYNNNFTMPTAFPNSQSMNSQLMNLQSMNPQSMNLQSVNPQSINPQLTNPQPMNQQLMNQQLTNPQSMNQQSMNQQSMNQQLMNQLIMNQLLLNQIANNSNLNQLASSQNEPTARLQSQAQKEVSMENNRPITTNQTKLEPAGNKRKSVLKPLVQQIASSDRTNLDATSKTNLNYRESKIAPNKQSPPATAKSLRRSQQPSNTVVEYPSDRTRESSVAPTVNLKSADGNVPEINKPSIRDVLQEQESLEPDSLPEDENKTVSERKSKAQRPLALAALASSQTRLTSGSYHNLAQQQIGPGAASVHRTLNADVGADKPTIFLGDVKKLERHQRDFQLGVPFVKASKAWIQMLKTQYSFRNGIQIVVDASNVGSEGLDFFSAIPTTHVVWSPPSGADNGDPGIQKAPLATLEKSYPSASAISEVATRVGVALSNVIAALESLTFERVAKSTDAILFPAALVGSSDRERIELPSTYLYRLEKSKLSVDPVSGRICDVSIEQKRMLFMYFLVVKVVVAQLLMKPLESNIIDKGVPSVMRNHFFTAYMLYRLVRLACYASLPNHPDLIQQEFHANICNTTFPPPPSQHLQANSKIAQQRGALCFYPWDLVKMPSFELMNSKSAVPTVNPLEQTGAEAISPLSPAYQDIMNIPDPAALAISTGEKGVFTAQPPAGLTPAFPVEYLEGTVGPLRDDYFQKVIEKIPAFKNHAGRLLNWSNSWVLALEKNAASIVRAKPSAIEGLAKSTGNLNIESNAKSSKTQKSTLSLQSKWALDVQALPTPSAPTGSLSL